MGPETIWQGSKGVTRDALKDSPSTTILIVENRGAEVHWMEPRDVSFSQMDFTLQRPNGISSRYADPAVAMVDCSVVRLTPKMSPDTLRAMLTINGGEKVGWDQEHGWQLLQDGRQRSVRQP